MDRSVTRTDLAVYALDMLGGRTRVVTTRDIANRCYELASGWFKRTQDSQRVDMGIVRKALTSAARVKNGSLVRRVRTGGLDGWCLTEAGAIWMFRNEDWLAWELREGKEYDELDHLNSKLAGIRQHFLYQRFNQDSQQFSPAMSDVAGAFRCRPDAEWRTWEKRFKAVWTAARIMQNGPMVTFVRRCKAAVRAQIEVPEDLRRVCITGSTD